MSSLLGLNQDDFSYLDLLLKAIDSRNWLVLEHTMRTNPNKFLLVADALAKCPQLNGMTILHACIRYDPPPLIVQMIIRLCPASPACVDCVRRTPLHVAAAIKANPQSIGLLVDAYPEAAAIKDADGKTPLHFACDINCELFEGEEGIVRPHSHMHVIRLLSLASPKTVGLEDDDGTSALEYAILSNSDILVVKFLMHTTQMQFIRDPSVVHGQYESKRNLEFILMQSKRHSISLGCSERTVSTV